MKKFYFLFAVIALVFASTFPLAAQTSYGAIAGSVTDQSGAVVSGATVTAVSKDTGESHKTATTSNGGFKIEALGTGVYDITAEAVGFSKQVVSGLVVAPSVLTSVNPVLHIGSAAETVEISSASEIIKTESGEVSATISTKEISELPINSLNPYALATTLPGVSTVTVAGFTNGTGFSVDGLRPRANNFLIEGQDNNDAGIAGQGLQPQNQEAIQSVTFFTSGASAEFGRGAGAVSNLVYKSGTNQFHGAVWDRLFNSSLNTYNHSTTYNGGVKSKTRENIYGFRIGGPIFHDKLFFFVSQQFDHYRSSAALSTLVLPTTAGYATLNQYKSNAQIAKLIQAYGGLTGYDAASGKFPSSIKSVALGADPVSGIDRGTVAFGGYQRVIGTPTNSNEFISKVDYQATEKDKFQFRFVRSPYSAPYDTSNFPSQLPLFDTQQVGISYNAGLVENHIFTPNILNEFRVSYGRIGFTFDLRPDTYSNPLLGPTVAISGVQGFGIPTNTPQGRFHNTYQLQDALTITHGHHSVKVGFDIGQIRVRDAIPFVFYGSQTYIAQTSGYTSLGNYMDDYSGNTGPSTTSLTKTFGSNIARPTLTNQGYYIQDHWKATSSLAIDLGLRYEYYGAPFNYVAYPAIDPNNLACFPTTSTVSCRVPVQPNKKNFGPRVGFAYTPFSDNKTVFRGAIGFFYDNVFTNVADNIQAAAPNAASPILYNSSTGRGTASWSTQFASLSSTPLPTNTVTSVVPNLRNPLTYQYNVAIERALPYSMSVTAGYIGSRQEHLYGLSYLNPTVPGSSTRITTTRGPISVHDNSGDGNYNGGTMQLARAYRSGSAFRLAYTYSKSMDDVSEEYSSGNYNAYPEQETALGGYRGRDYGPSAFDHKQRVVLSTVYSVPKWRTSGYKKALADVVNGFQVSTIISFQSGSVLNVLDGLDVNGDGVNNDRPVLSNATAPVGSFGVRAVDYYSGTVAATNGSICDGTYLANAYSKNPVTGVNDNFCHVVDPNTVHYLFGTRYTQNNTIRRNSNYSPGVFSGDASIQRTFPIYEKIAFDFRGELYNFLNHANTGIPNAILYSAGNQPNAVGYSFNTFLNYAPTTTGARTVRFFLKLSF